MAITKQNGGWYWNSATGKSEQYWDSPVSNTDYTKVYNDNYNQMAGEVNKYADELIAKAQGDFDYAAKWLESNYKVALGTDDTERAAFIKEVANDLEKKVGRVAYDYKTGKYRLEQDLTTGTDRATENNQIALKRLAEDEKAYKTSFARQLGETRVAEDASLNERGLMNGTRESTTGLGTTTINNTEATAADTLAAYQRSIDNAKQDSNLTMNRTISDLGLATGRGIEDLTTTSRREGIDEQQTYTQGLEAASRAKEQARLEAEAERRRSLNAARTLSYQGVEKGISNG